MPVDLTIIPDAARRRRPPSLKRWSMVLLIFLVCGGFLTSWLWPADRVARGALFWHCFISAPVVTWLILFGVRWLYYLSFEWPAEGWDDEREQDIANEILRGQRSLVLEGQSVQLPHIVSSGGLTQQFILPQGVLLPAVVNENTKAVSYQASFNDMRQTLSERVSRRLNALLKDSAIQTALSQRCAVCPLMVVIQVDSKNELSEEDITGIQKYISPLLPELSMIHFLPQFGLADIDRWLDFPDSIDSMLILSVHLQLMMSNGEGEAAVALLLRLATDHDSDEQSVAHIHRPELSRGSVGFHAAAMQALQWGKTCTGDIASLWLTGMGIENKAQTLLASNNFKFPRAENNAQLIDIDTKSGNTGAASPWLAIALAAGNIGPSPYPQLIMSIPETDTQPWWLVVHPPSA